MCFAWTFLTSSDVKCQITNQVSCFVFLLAELLDVLPEKRKLEDGGYSSDEGEEVLAISLSNCWICCQLMTMIYLLPISIHVKSHACLFFEIMWETVVLLSLNFGVIYFNRYIYKLTLVVREYGLNLIRIILIGPTWR